MVMFKRLTIETTIALCDWLRKNVSVIEKMTYSQIAEKVGKEIDAIIAPSSVKSCCDSLGLKLPDPVLSLNTRALAGMIKFLAERLLLVEQTISGSVPGGVAITNDERYRSIIASTTFKKDNTNGTQSK
jgi:hypothetical protein